MRIAYGYLLHLATLPRFPALAGAGSTVLIRFLSDWPITAGLPL